MSDVPIEQPLDYPLPAPAALEPPAEWARLRQQCPVARVKLPSGDEAALVTRYEDVRSVLADPRFTRELNAPGAARIIDTESGGLFNSPVANTLAAEGHARWRRMVGKWFTARRMAALRPGIEATADRLVDGMLEHGQPADLVTHLAFPLPVWVICDMLGAPESDRDRFAHWSDVTLSLTEYSGTEIDAAQHEFTACLTDLVDTKREQPGDDLLSELLAVTDAEGRPMSDAGLVATAQALLVAGHETTASMIAKMVAMLLADRRHWERLAADRTLVRTAVEEILRFDPNGGFGLPRFLHEDAEISSGLLPSGTTVVCSMAAANRDDSAFESAGELDLGRSPNPHLAFGAGAHSCLGQPLARTELQVVLDVLLRRLPTLDLAVGADELRRVEGLVVGRLHELPVRW
ncbi:cytochrome P450 [Streptomyces resistomycificus]|uniref:Cytochrome P450 n=1 Tax=Streptomyces resistomycificus TaxID=67356 RepID=A0A0L8L7Q9_9ACTN|nr:cytochrome P450 [Streptomyces resistomycificus]KOG34187.1 cytochrome P450 [Streptomyces resistomycificus]KUN95540.1 cytochrome [Streptomyces resistomycificus]